MTSEFVIKLAGEAVYTVLKASAPMLIIALVVGLIISVFQATTQIQEQTLAFIPKIIAIFVAILVFGPWMLSLLVDYTHDIFVSLPHLIK